VIYRIKGLFAGIFLSKKDKRLAAAIKTMVGRKPFNLTPYKLSLIHSSIAKPNIKGFKESNERLEYLGDAILGAVIADYLFKKYPFKDEGFLTEIRSRIVNRESLNLLARKIGLDKMIKFEDSGKTVHSHKSLYGDTLEAFVGAVYLDKGYLFCQKFILTKLLLPHFDLETIVSTDVNFKSKIIEWAQKENKEAKFEIVDVKSVRNHKEFIAHLIIDDEVIGVGHGLNKKKAEQDAALKGLEKLNIS
jgi:ribonuclease III